MVRVCLRPVDRGQFLCAFKTSLGVVHQRGRLHQQVVGSGFRGVTDLLKGDDNPYSTLALRFCRWLVSVRPLAFAQSYRGVAKTRPPAIDALAPTPRASVAGRHDFGILLAD